MTSEINGGSSEPSWVGYTGSCFSLDHRCVVRIHTRTPRHMHTLGKYNPRSGLSGQGHDGSDPFGIVPDSGVYRKKLISLATTNCTLIVTIDQLQVTLLNSFNVWLRVISKSPCRDRSRPFSGAVLIEIAVRFALRATRSRTAVYDACPAAMRSRTSRGIAKRRM